MKRSIPSATSNQQDINRAVKENLEIIMGQRVAAIKPLSDSATTADIINKLNEIIDRLQ